MIPNRDPASLAPEDRSAEIAQILATAYARLLLSREKALAASPSAEASCDLVNSRRTDANKEVA